MVSSPFVKTDTKTKKEYLYYKCDICGEKFHVDNYCCPNGHTSKSAKMHVTDCNPFVFRWNICTPAHPQYWCGNCGKLKNAKCDYCYFFGKKAADEKCAYCMPDRFKCCQKSYSLLDNLLDSALQKYGGKLHTAKPTSSEVIKIGIDPTKLKFFS